MIGSEFHFVLAELNQPGDRWWLHCLDVTESRLPLGQIPIRKFIDPDRRHISIEH